MPRATKTARTRQPRKGALASGNCSAKFLCQLDYLIRKAKDLEKRIKSCRNPETKELLEAHYGMVGRAMLEIIA